MKNYLNGLGIFLFIAITFGYGAPTLVSAADTFMVIAGFAWVFVLAPVVVWYWARKAFLPKKGE